MAGVDNIVAKLVALWKKAVVRNKFYWVFMIISIVGSVLKEVQLVPKTYFSNSKNLLNLYFVKISWGWTLALLFPFILLSNFRNWTFVLQRLTSLVVATAIWYTCTETFFYIEDVTGVCYELENTAIIHGEFASKKACRSAGFIWNGYDISGHSFILAYSALIIVEEMAAMVDLRKTNQGYKSTILDILYISLNGIVAIWIWMFGCTSVYFHDMSDKILGTACGILGWYLTYKVWYPKPMSPGLPPQQSEQKQHA